MDKEIYTAKIEHNEKTIELLYKARYHAYEKPQMFIRFVIAVAMIFAAVFLNLPLVLRSILVLLGAWFLVSLDFPASLQADKVLENRKAALPKMCYEFDANKVNISGEGSMNISYKKFQKISYDHDYLYLFENPTSVCMIDRETISPKNDIQFMAFISEKTNKSWEHDKSFALLNIHDIRQMLADSKAKKKGGKR